MTPGATPSGPGQRPSVRLPPVLGDRYRIGRELGHGGMATVYLADDLRLDAPVAIKVLRPDIVALWGADRFAREIRITAQLHHPNIIGIIDSGEIDGVPYYVMPFVEGQTLRHRLEREGPLPIAETIAIAGQIADGLAHAHAQGFIHRDVKPANVLLIGGHAMLADFGIARAAEQLGDTQLTESGIAVGTVGYMSPEQSGGQTLDARSDVYSLGCVAYEMLTGAPPFTGPSARAVLARQSLDPVPSVRSVRDTVPPGLERAILRALAKVPADRWKDATAFKRALEASETASDVIGSTSRRWPALAGGLAVAVLALAGAVRVWAPGRSPLSPDHVMVYPLVLPDGFAGPRSAGEDVATIIGNALDGAGPLRWVDGWSELAPEQRGDIRRVTLSEARAIAREKGCGYFVTGRVVARGDSADVILDLNATHGDTIVGRGRGTGLAASAWQPGLRALNEILPRLLPGGATDLTAEWNDRDPGAIAAFLLGEAAFRRLRLPEAFQRYRDALRADSVFALAAIRGAQVASWLHEPSEAAVMIQRTQGLPLTPRYAHFAAGFDAYLHGRADSAANEFRAALAIDPDMLVASVQLGEVYTHLLPLEGDLDSLAGAAFDRAMARDSLAANVLLHPIEARLRRGDTTTAGPLLRRFLAGNPDTILTAKLRLIDRCVRAGPRSVDWRAEAVTRPLSLVSAAKSMASGGARLDCARPAFNALLRYDTAATDDAAGRRWVSLLGLFSEAMARDRPEEATALADSAAQRWGFGLTLFLLAAPSYPALLPRAREVAESDRARYGRGYERLPFARRIWEYGIIEATSGDPEMAKALALDLHRRAEGGDRYVQGLARSVDAFVTLAAGDTARAIALFTDLVKEALVHGDLAWDEAEPRAFERIVLCRLLMAQGEYRRVIDIARVFDSAWPLVSLLYLRPSLELRIEAASALGDRMLEDRLKSRLESLGGV